MNITRIVGFVALGITAASAQWLKVTTPGVPRLSDGKPNLAAPAPKLADGKPDLQGVWNADSKFLRNIAAEMKPGEIPMQSWAVALHKERLAGIHSHEEPDANCLPQGVPKIDAAPAPWRIVQTPNMVFIIY